MVIILLHQHGAWSSLQNSVIICTNKYRVSSKSALTSQFHAQLLLLVVLDEPIREKKHIIMIIEIPADRGRRLTHCSGRLAE